nr:hypothetical protein [Clostridia bacterium]
MANEDNLKGHGFHERTASEQREIASMGGKASGKSRREQAAFRDCFNAILDEDGGKYNGETVSKKQLIAIKALKYLLDSNDLSAHEFARMFEVVRDTVGEKPVERVEQLNIDAEYEQSVAYVRKLMGDDAE